MSGNRENVKDKLIQAGIEELNRYGAADFSMRRVSAKCGVSCAAPYKHFENRKDFIYAIIKYVNSQWQKVQENILKEAGNDTESQIIELSINYVKFLVENPNLRTILMLKEGEFDNTYHKKDGEMESVSQRLIDKFCDDNNIPAELRTSRTFIIRSLIFGAVMVFGNGEAECNDETLELLRSALKKEFSR